MQRAILAKNAEAEFNDAMTRVQAEVGQCRRPEQRPDAQQIRLADVCRTGREAAPPTTPRTGSAFRHRAGIARGFVRVLAYVSHSAGHTCTYNALVPARKGAKGRRRNSKTHAFGCWSVLR